MVKKTIKQKTIKASKPKTKKTAKPKNASEQPVINIGFFGHVDHGKTTLTEALSGKWTDTHSEEMKRGITIRLGYANTTIYKKGKTYTTDPKENGTLIRTVSFIDAPGHESLMATMLAGATIIDGALLLVAANETCPQPQTREHLQALEILGVDKIIVVQNKIDLVDKERLMKNYQQIKEFLKGTSYADAPIIPISAMHRVNIDVLLETIEDIFLTPVRDGSLDPLMLIARSFDINKPGILPNQLKGGVLGGSLKQGIFKLGDEIEIRPGYFVEERNRQMHKPLFTKIIGLMTGSTSVDLVNPGGSVALLTELDPSIVKSDILTGAIVGHPGKLPPVLYELELEIHLLERVVGTREELVVEPIKLREPLMLNVNSAATVGIVSKLGKKKILCALKRPVCCELGSRVTISRRLGNRFRLIGYGVIKNS
ncbi:translation initiation factor IF-2 subunit gamma [Candidatus Woesearchaeota archaeon CG10_big_fil_rev_8_21_14_0_10_34_8]|nr:MAG: translation initiation factor IF-2 subunit gamma [Candidatus Woesearchaeota archaeon CG10_big_fil_rev_8_21_14_0_10_34_8]